ncbi:MAG: hypothetical protein AAGD22_08325 [Verrucomicrobiota bacterium]
MIKIGRKGPKAAGLRVGECKELEGPPAELLEELSEMGPLYATARNVGGAMGKLVEAGSVLIDEESGFAMDPAAGWSLSLDEWIALHVAVMRNEGREVSSLEFDFRGQTLGLSMVEVPTVSRVGVLQEAAARYPGQVKANLDLDVWRREIEPSVSMCGNCGAAAMRRARYPRQHPLFLILQHAMQHELPLHCRLFGQHMDFRLELTPKQVTPMEGFVLASDENGMDTLHIDLKWVHAFVVGTTRIDGDEWGSIGIYDMHGNRNIEIATPDEEMVGEWRLICDTAESFYRERKRPEGFGEQQNL